MKAYNFSAGPSVMSEKVLKKAANELLEYKNTGQSVMEMSHRSQEYIEIFNDTKTKLIEMLNIPNNYKVLFLQGGASLQFSMIPLNLFKKFKKAAVINTGEWSTKAINELKKFGDVEVIASSEDKVFSYIPKEYTIPEDIDYLYICENNTIFGTKYKELPKTTKTLVADLSSCIMSEEIDVSKYGIIFAGAQKNLGMAGLTLVIIREDLIEEKKELPSMLSFKIQSDNDSMFNTPPTYAIYMLGLVLDWIKEEFGNLKNLELHNIKKANILYDFLDQSNFFKGTVAKEDRSLMNIPFVLPTEELDKLFIAKACKNNFINLSGHRKVGGMRASLYNAMSLEGVEELVKFMRKFEGEHYEN